MSQYVSPFLVINLGAEMIYVIAQRLEAQRVSVERSEIVLDEILTSLLSKPLICELMKPQTVYTHEAVREIVEDVAQCSAMRLDPVSMNKLWDLITMVFKWQVTLCNEIFKITTRHLREVKTYTSKAATKLQVQRVQNIVDNFAKLLDKNDENALREGVLAWVKPFNVRVSLLLRLGLQNMDGAFVVNNTDLITREMLNNLGENIYAVTQNGKALQRCLKHQDNGDNNNVAATSSVETNELNFFMEQIGARRPRFLGIPGKTNALTLSIGENDGSTQTEVKKVHFATVDVDRVNANEVTGLFEDLADDGADGNTTFQEELVEMMASDT